MHIMLLVVWLQNVHLEKTMLEEQCFIGTIFKDIPEEMKYINGQIQEIMQIAQRTPWHDMDQLWCSKTQRKS